MSNDTTNGGGESQNANTAPTTAATAAPTAAAPAADSKAAVDADRQRTNAILSCEEAKGREELARHFALETDMSVDSAKKALGLAPKTEAAAAGNAANPAFMAAMNNGDNPNVGVDGGADPGKQSVSDRIAANYHAATGGIVKRKD